MARLQNELFFLKQKRCNDLVIGLFINRYEFASVYLITKTQI